jgi:hypothetical protein
MNVSSSFTRCGVFETYLLYMPWRMSWASAPPVDFAGRAGVEVGGTWGPVEAGARCLGGIVGRVYVYWVLVKEWNGSALLCLASKMISWGYGVEWELRKLEATCSGGRARCVRRPTRTALQRSYNQSAVGGRRSAVGISA